MHPFPFSKGLPLAEIQPQGEVGEGSRGTNLRVDRAKRTHHYQVLFSLTARQLSGVSEGFLSLSQGTARCEPAGGDGGIACLLPSARTGQLSS